MYAHNLPVNLLILSKYDRLGASSRLRTMQYLPALDKAGFSVSVESLFDAAYLEDLYAGKRNRAAIIASYGRRLAALRRTAKTDLIWLEKEALPWFPAPAEQALLPAGVPIVADYDDAVFHRYDSHPSPLVRRLLGEKIAKVMKRAELVLAGNAYIRNYAIRAGARSIEIVPTVVDTDAYDATPRNGAAECVTVGWIGTPGTWRDCVTPLLPDILDGLCGLPANILAVGAGESSGDGAPLLEVRAWSEKREAADIRDMDIGIMPLPDTPWMRGKCGYKLIQYMASGLPVIASPVGVNADIVEHGVNGFLASSAKDWRVALQTLVGNPDLRRRMGQVGREKVERSYSLEVQGPRVVDLLTCLARSGKA